MNPIGLSKALTIATIAMRTAIILQNVLRVKLPRTNDPNLLRAWARLNYKPRSFINGKWPVEIQHECVQINAEIKSTD